MIKRLLAGAAVVSVSLFVLIQAVPYRVSNPPVLQEPAWDSPQTRAMAERACFDCHSNQVEVPWYGRIAPLSWVVRQHVDEGRAEMNLSEMHRPQSEAHEAGEVVSEGEMPPAYYLLLHPEARLSDAERTALAAGLNATLGTEDEGSAGSAGGHHEDHDEDHDDDDDDDDD